MSAAVSLSLLLVGFTLLGRAALALRGTTLLAACLWAALALVAVHMAELAGRSTAAEDYGWLRFADSLRYAAAMSSFCPIVAVLGAKRPQHRAWQGIVLTLWIVLALPALSQAWLRPGAAFRLDGLRAGVICLLLGVELFCYLPTRYWLSSLFLAAGQYCLVAPYAPALAGFAPAGSTFALACLNVAIVTAVVSQSLSRRDRPPLTTIWQDFRDAYGAVWALRVSERLNAAAAKDGRAAHLSWKGFSSPTPADPETSTTPGEAAQHRLLLGLLRRFVSRAWIERRLAGAAAIPNAPGA